MSRFGPDVFELARGKWRGLLMAAGLPDRALNGKHGPCPFCEGKDRWIWDNKGGNGGGICQQCGAFTGFQLLQRWQGLEGNFGAAADWVRAQCGHVPQEPVKAAKSQDDRRKALREVSGGARAIAPGDPVDRYLHRRGVGEVSYPRALRSHPRLWFSGFGEAEVCYPAMVAVISDAQGNPVGLHRTFLAPDGPFKAPVEDPRRIMSPSTKDGTYPDASAVRLGEAGRVLGVAEGIETALAASARFEVPVWAALNTSMLARWYPPEGVEEVLIAADNDAKFGGQAAAYRLAQRLAVKGFEVSVKVPEIPGTDWLDIWNQQRAAA